MVLNKCFFRKIESSCQKVHCLITLSMKQTLLLSHWALLFSSKTSNACLEMKSVSNSLDINVKRISCEEGNPKGQREPHKKHMITSK